MKKWILAVGASLMTVPAVLGEYVSEINASDIDDVVIDQVGAFGAETKPFLPLLIIGFIIAAMAVTTAAVIAKARKAGRGR